MGALSNRWLQPWSSHRREATRDFVKVSDVAELNFSALTTDNENALGEAYNVASGSTLSVLELFTTLRDILATKQIEISQVEPNFAPLREGDILHSSASIEKAKELLGFNPEMNHHLALTGTVEFYWEKRA